MAAKKTARKGAAGKAGAKKAARKPTAKKTAAQKARAKPPARATPRPRRSGGDWRARTLARVRRLVSEAVPGVVEEAKWRKPTNPEGVPTWSREGILFTGETYKDKVKLTFARGAALPDPARLFNASLEGGTRRAIDLREGDALDEEAFKALARAAAELNAARAR
ncbi:MAG TPA: DUF1801 domain-containing protein [Candidatus Thermoplasmatota archaeon]|nr:DUF1801 domain-containing protein [Candidatus Thermoplasmatota archaeon]